MLEQPLDFTGCSSIQFFNSPPSPNTVSEAARGTFPLTVQHLCDLREPMTLHWSASASHTNPYLKKQRISVRVANILIVCFSHIPNLLPTRRYYLVGFIYGNVQNSVYSVRAFQK